MTEPDSRAARRAASAAAHGDTPQSDTAQSDTSQSDTARGIAPQSTALRRPGWWRRNRVALAVLVALLPVGATAVSVNEWLGNRTEAAFPDATVAAGETIAADGAVFGPASLDDVTAEVTAPPGARAFEARVAADLGAAPADVACDIRSLVESDGAGRRWLPASLDGWSPPAGTTAACSSESARGSVVVSTLFLVPDDAGPLVLDLSVGGDGGFVRFELD